MIDMINMVPVSGNGWRPSLFGGNVDKTRSFHPTLGRHAWLGETTPADWYLRSVQALKKFDDLLARTGRIAYQTAREEILGWVGRAAVSDTPAWNYAVLRRDMDLNVENFTPPNVNAFQVAGRQKLVENLETVNKTFESRVQNGEEAFGTLAQPVVIDREKIVGMSNSSKWVLPIIVGVAAIGVAAVISLVGKP